MTEFEITYKVQRTEMVVAASEDEAKMRMRMSLKRR